MIRSLIFIVMLLALAGCKNWSDLSVGQKLLIVNPELIEIAGEGVFAGAELAGKGITEFSECVVELKEKTLDESKYRGFVECSPINK